MSAAFLEQVAAGHHQARSAGTRPAAQVHDTVVEVMKEAGMDLTGRVPQKLSPELSEWADVVVTMGCGDECPYLPGKRYIDWELIDPKGKTLTEVRQIRDDIQRRVKELAAQLG
jgi:arsenate reductase